MTTPLSILVVDDESAILNYLETILVSYGHNVLATLCCSEEDAANIINSASTSPFDVAIVDVIMPGMDGVQLTERLRFVSPATLFILSDAGLCIEAAEHLKSNGIWVTPLLKPFESQEVERILTDSASRHGCDFRRLMRPKLKADANRGLAHGDKLVRFLEPLILKDLFTFDLSSASPEIRPKLQSAAERLAFYGLRMHCLLIDPNCRFQHDAIMDLGDLEETWLPKSLIASRYMQAYTEPSRNVLRRVFNDAFDREVEPIQKDLGLGWWRRMFNRTKFRNLYDSAALLGFIYDLKSKELAERHSKF